MASVAAKSAAKVSVEVEEITGGLHGSVAMWLCSNVALLQCGSVAMRAGPFCSAQGGWTLAIVWTVEKQARPRKQTRCRALFRGRQHPQDRGMSARPAPPAGIGEIASKIA